MVKKIKFTSYSAKETVQKRKNATLNAGDTVLVDTCSLIEGKIYIWKNFSNIKVLPQTFKELSKIIAKKSKLSKLDISTKTLEVTVEIETKARRFYRKYGLVWGLSYVDCLYLAAAKFFGIPLMSCDRALLKASEKEGVKTIPMYLSGRGNKQTLSIVLSKVTCENVSFLPQQKKIESDPVSKKTEASIKVKR